MSAPILLVNFGGPRNGEEIEPFLKELLCDPDVIRTRFPKWLHDWFFKRVAKKRALKIRNDYERIGFSPIYGDTEGLRLALEQASPSPILTFHRYLPSTHENSLRQIEERPESQIRALPLFPQFCYGTTGSVARFFSKRLSPATLAKLHWVKSYADHPSFIEAWQKRITRFIAEKNLKSEEICLFFSAHGVPQAFIDGGDPYKEECERSFHAVMKGFPNIPARLAYQSKFGRGEWLRPYTDEECKKPFTWAGSRKHVVFVPISFTSDHIETLFEIEELYLPLVRAQGLQAHRCPALNRDPAWLTALRIIADHPTVSPNHALIRN